jgi:hypothetical protein
MELLALGGLAAIGYFMSKKPIGNRVSVNSTHKPLSESDVVPKRFEESKHPYKTGVFSDKVFIDGLPPPMFKSRSLVHDEASSFKKLELFTGSEGNQGGINLRQNKTEKGTIFAPAENVAPVTFSGTSGNILFSDIDRNRYQAGVGNLQQNVSCTTQERDIPALQQDPLFTYTPYVPHQKPGAHPLPMPSEGFQTKRPDAAARTVDPSIDVRPRKVLPQTYATSHGANLAGRDVYQTQTIRSDVLLDGRSNRKNVQAYTGNAKFSVEEPATKVHDSNGFTRYVEDRGNPIEYFGSGQRSFGPSSAMVPDYEGHRRQNLSAMHLGHGAATGVLPETGKATFGEYQLRNKTGSDLSTGTEPRPFSVMGQQGPVDQGPMRPKRYAEAEARMNGVSRNFHGVERLEPTAPIKERFETGPVNTGVPLAAAIPQAYMDSTFAQNAECNERAWVQDAPLRGAMGNKALDMGQSEHKRCEATFDTTVLQPTHVANPETLPETQVATKDGCRVPVENAYVPLTMLGS